MVKSDVKRQKIEKSRAAREARAEQEHDQSRPPFGMTYDDTIEQWVPDSEASDAERTDFRKALNVVRARENGLSWRIIAAETGVHKDVARNSWERKKQYPEEAETAVQ